MLPHKNYLTGSKLTELLKQSQYSPMTVAEQVISVFTGVKGYLDSISLNKVKAFENKVLEKVSEENTELIQKLNETGKLDDEIEDNLKNIIDKISKE